MDNEYIILISVVNGLSLLCLCCICIKGLIISRILSQQRSRKRMREIAEKNRENLRYNYVVYPEEVILIINPEIV
jgi:hypothetical protein